MADLHPALEPLAFLLGTWSGRGAGEYPTIEPFTYTETIELSHVGKPFLAYTQRTRDAVTGEPRHAEAGYFRPVGTDQVELVVAQPSGIVEVHSGTLVGRSIELSTVAVATSPSAKEVSAVQRRIEVDGDTLRYVVEMAAVGQPLQHHLRAELTRVGA